MDPSHRPAFDHGELLDRMGGDQDLLVEILGIFREESTRMLTDVRTAVEAEDAHRIERAAHSLKGALLNIAAGPAAERALELEHLGREGRIADCADVLARLESKISELEAALP
jgi:HPt (histidine-containing phosphotransfer) domain-containing protein